MTRYLSVLVMIASPLSLAADNADDVKKELKALEGKWKAVSTEAQGLTLPKDKIPPFTFIVGANGKSVVKFGDVEDQATITVDPKKNPKTIDNSNESGVSKGKKQYGIYKLEGDKWTVSMTPPGAAESDRPKNFETKDSTSVLFIFERVKNDKKP
jgi:uncharacterized protein (TIGR03067 family)